MARFRLFGRTAVDEESPAPAAAPGPPPGWAAAPPPVGAGVPWPAQATGAGYGPATRAARPVRSGSAAHPAAPPTRAPQTTLTRPDPGSGHRHPASDPPTDPHGFPPIAPSGYGANGRRSVPMPEPAEASALAGAFAVDYLSWDQDNPERRGHVLTDYLSAPGSDPARLGWSGRGRQRAEFALPGRVRADGDGRVLVDVRVRVTPYRPVGERTTDTVTAVEAEPDIAGIPAVAPAPTARGWRSLASYWIRLSVPVALEGGRLVVDAWEETLGELPAARSTPRQPPSAPSTPAPSRSVPSMSDTAASAGETDDHTLVDDDPLVDQRSGGGW